MSGWNGGYVTDINYTVHHYPEASAHNLALVARLNGFATDIPDRRNGVHTLELGCGRGMDAVLTAICNPGWQVTAIDFMPGAIADARALAAAAGADNVTFIEADLSDFHATAEARALPPVDAVTMHGVWSWVADPVQRGIVALLAAKVKPGGLVHVSYNALPGMQGALGLQRVVSEGGRRLHARSDIQASHGLALARALREADAPHLRTTVVDHLLGMIGRVPQEYLAHEYMNGVWRPYFQADVGRAMAEAKLDYVGVARLMDNFRQLMLTEKQLELYRQAEADIPLRELIVDCSTVASFRHDVYVRGARPMAPEEQHAQLCDITMALAVPAEKFVYAIDVAAGRASLNEAFYRPIVEALAERPRQVGELLDIGGTGRRTGNAAELVGILIGTGQAIHLARPEGGLEARVAHCNRVLAHRMVRPEMMAGPGVLAASRSGGGIRARIAEMFVAERYQATGGAVDPAVWAAELGPDLPAEQFATLCTLLGDTLAERLPVWRHAGAI